MIHNCLEYDNKNRVLLYFSMTACFATTVPIKIISSTCIMIRIKNVLITIINTCIIWKNKIEGLNFEKS